VEQKGISAAVLVAVLVALGVAGGIVYYVLTLGYGTTLTPAREITGTWQTSFPTTFYIQTDFQTGELQDVGTEERVVTWVITEGSSENTVNIEQRFTVSSRNLVSGSGYIPDVSPSFFQGIISGSRLTVMSGSRIVGEFSFTSYTIQGTWDDSWSMVYSQRVYTPVNGLILNKL